MSASTVLVTGCAGYVGSVLVGRLLDAGYRVVGVDSLVYDNGPALLPHLGRPRFEFVAADVRDVPAVAALAARCDVVMPLAALVGAPACDRDADARRAAEAVNCTAVRGLVAGLSRDQLVVYPNTNSGYGETDGSRACTEADPLAPISTYGRTKCAGEDAVLGHPRAVSLRLATVFGASPRMRLDLLVNDFTARLVRAGRLELFEPHFVRNFVGVRDVARAFLHMAGWLERGGAGGAYNLGHPDLNLTKRALALTVAGLLGLGPACVTTGPGTDPDRRNYLVSNDKVLGTGFRFEHDLGDGVRAVAAAVRAHTPDQLARMRNA